MIVASFQPLTIITKHSILDVAAALDPPLPNLFLFIKVIQDLFAMYTKLQPNMPY